MKLYFESTYDHRKSGILASDYYYDPKEAIMEDPEEYKDVILGVDDPRDAIKYFKEVNGELYIPAGTKLNYHHSSYYYSYYKMVGTPLLLGFTSDDAMEWYTPEPKERSPKTNVAKVVKIMNWDSPDYRDKVSTGYSCKWEHGDPWYLFLLSNISGEWDAGRNYWADIEPLVKNNTKENEEKAQKLLDLAKSEFEADVKAKTGLDVKVKFMGKDINSRMHKNRIFIPFE